MLHALNLANKVLFAITGKVQDDRAPHGLLLSALIFSCLWCFVQKSAAEGILQPSRRQSALASDRTHDAAEEVARDILQLQQQLGGSVVSDRPQLQKFRSHRSFNSPPLDSSVMQHGAPVTQRGQAMNFSPGYDYPIDQPMDRSKVSELREAAWQLDTTAHRLERLDLYEQADALREVAHRILKDARALKQTEKSE